jgi:hypothetical protein
MVLVSARHAGQNSSANALSKAVSISVRTLQRWRTWWQQAFVSTSFWQVQCARFMPSVLTSLLPASLLERFNDSTTEALHRLLVFLCPITQREGV